MDDYKESYRTSYFEVIIEQQNFLLIFFSSCHHHHSQFFYQVFRSFLVEILFFSFMKVNLYFFKSGMHNMRTECGPRNLLIRPSNHESFSLFIRQKHPSNETKHIFSLLDIQKNMPAITFEFLTPTLNYLLPENSIGFTHYSRLLRS